jgi:hypothetical protein
MAKYDVIIYLILWATTKLFMYNIRIKSKVILYLFIHVVQYIFVGYSLWQVTRTNFIICIVNYGVHYDLEKTSMYDPWIHLCCQLSET